MARKCGRPGVRHDNAGQDRRSRKFKQGLLAGSVAAVLNTLAVPAAHAFQFDTGLDDLSARWDNTVKYSTGIRVKEPSAQLTADANQDDGDRNFKAGDLISNRFDLLSEFDLSYKSFGVRLSGAAWYDSVYNRSTSNNSPFTANASSVPYNEFPQATRDVSGRQAEVLDAFAYGETNVGNVDITGRIGQHSVLYGETLFFGNNGIAGAQSPVDLLKLLSVPDTQFKELIRPVPQLSAQFQLLPNLAVGGYYQARWDRDRLPGVGSYFSTVDILDTGGERILAGPNPVPGGPGLYFSRVGDIEPKNSGEGGMQIRFRPKGQDVEYGFYAAQFHDKDPIVYVHPGAGYNASAGQIGTYQLVFPENIKTVGSSFSTTVWGVNVAGEASIRYNMPLVPQGGSVVVPQGVTADNNNNPRYPVGKTAHANLSWISLLQPGPLWQGGSLIGEFAWNRRLSVSKNAAALDPNSTRDAGAIRIVFQPEYFQVLSGLDINVPIGIGYGLFGKSSVINPGFSVYHGGDMSIGINGEYLKVWKFGLNYTHYYGGGAGIIGPANAPVQAFTYGQVYKDRDFVTLSVQRTF